MSKPEAHRPARIRLPSGGRTKFLARIPNKDVEEFKKVGGEVSMNEALILGFRGWLRKQHQAMSIAAPKTAKEDRSEVVSLPVGKKRWGNTSTAAVE